MWWYMWRAIPHMKDEALAMQAFAVEQLPVPQPSDDHQQALEQHVGLLVRLADERQACQRRFYSELSADLGVEHPSRKLEQFWRLDRDALETELQRAARRPFGRIGTRLDGDYTGFITKYRCLLAESLHLERQVQRIVFDLYGLTPQEVGLLRGSAPPRDPLALVEEEARMIGLDLREAP